MVAPVKVSALACSRCGKVYPDNGFNFELAEACCRCTECGQPGSEYIGSNSKCKRCRLTSALNSLREQHASATADLAALEARVKALGIA